MEECGEFSLPFCCFCWVYILVLKFISKCDFFNAIFRFSNLCFQFHGNEPAVYSPPWNFEVKKFDVGYTRHNYCIE